MATTAAPQNESSTIDPGFDPPNFEELVETMNFDPFGPTSKTEGEGEHSGTQEGEATAQGAEPPAQTPPRQESQPAKEASPSADSSAPAPEGDSKDKALEDLRALVQGFIAKEAGRTQEQPQAQPQAQPAPQAQPEQPAYRLQLPSQIKDALESDDREIRHAALDGIVNSIMNKLAADFGAAMRQMYHHIQQNVVPQTVQGMTAHERQVTAIKEDFYGNFPEFRTMAERVPGLENTLWNTIGQVAQAQGVQNWSPEFRNQVGHYLRTSFGISGQSQPQQTPPAAKPPRRAPFAAGSGTPARGNEGTSAGSNEFLEVLNAGNV